MPPPTPLEYNPNILGFVAGRGPIIISLEEARSRYGKLPSDFEFVPKKEGRQNKKGLNLDIGKTLTETLNRAGTNLKHAVFDFFEAWHRDYAAEFNINLDPFFNLTSPERIKHVIRTNAATLAALSRLHLRDHLEKHQLIRRDVLNSIQEKELSETAERMLSRKIKHLNNAQMQRTLADTLVMIRANRILGEVKAETTFDITREDYSRLPVYADEIAKGILALSSHQALSGIDKLQGIRGHGVEFEFATRNRSYLDLGKETGDCTAHKAPFQADQDTENIYWTVFPWLLDRNYQILKIYFQGELVMKFHLLPLFVIKENEGRMTLAVDGIETVRAFRDDIQGLHREDLVKERSMIFDTALEKVAALAGRMGIDHIYAERFSNTPWVRERLDALPEIYLHVNHIVKLDELEDVFTLAQELSRSGGKAIPQELFMEVQMKNTALLPRVTSKTAGIKSFATIKGDPAHGIPMKQAIGV
jgi:hypothetical protein